MILGLSTLVFLPVEVVAQQCPDDHKLTRDTIIQWLWSTEDPFEYMRNEYAVPRIDSTAIRVLNESSDGFVCSYLRSTYGFNATINAKHDEGSRRYFVTFYQAGSYFFVVKVPAPYPDPDYITTGLTNVHVLDDALNRMGGFAY